MALNSRQAAILNDVLPDLDENYKFLGREQYLDAHRKGVTLQNIQESDALYLLIKDYKYGTAYVVNVNSLVKIKNASSLDIISFARDSGTEVIVDSNKLKEIAARPGLGARTLEAVGR